MKWSAPDVYNDTNCLIYTIYYGEIDKSLETNSFYYGST